MRLGLRGAGAGDRPPRVHRAVPRDGPAPAHSSGSSRGTPDPLEITRGGGESGLVSVLLCRVRNVKKCAVLPGAAHQKCAALPASVLVYRVLWRTPFLSSCPWISVREYCEALARGRKGRQPTQPLLGNCSGHGSCTRRRPGAGRGPCWTFSCSIFITRRRQMRMQVYSSFKRQSNSKLTLPVGLTQNKSGRARHFFQGECNFCLPACMFALWRQKEHMSCKHGDV